VTEAKYGIIIVAAPSGTGKSTLCARLLHEENKSIQLSVSTTSRPPRGKEQNDKEYFFVSSKEFEHKIAAGDFAEWAQVHENFYGTEKKVLEDYWAKGFHALLDIDVQGAHSLRKLYPKQIFTVFLMPPSMQELERRLRSRGTDSEDAIVKRMANAKLEIDRKEEFDAVIINDTLDQAYLELKSAIQHFTKDLEAGLWPKRP
jgi:guanylate kinase